MHLSFYPQLSTPHREQGKKTVEFRMGSFEIKLPVKKYKDVSSSSVNCQNGQENTASVLLFTTCRDRENLEIIQKGVTEIIWVWKVGLVSKECGSWCYFSRGKEQKLVVTKNTWTLLSRL